MTRERNRGDKGDRSPFTEAMKGVKPLVGRDKARPPPQKTTAGRPADAASPIRFEVSHSGEQLEGRAPGIDRKHLRRLRTGDVPVDARVDLHGLHGPEAREAVHNALIDAAEAGLRCVLVIHGRGLGSESGPVLKQALPGWLAEAPIGASVMAFASATPEDGGGGATYVLMRRRRSEKSG